MASWGDEATQDDFLPARSVSGPDENGVKTITEYRRLPGGKKEKIVTRIKTVRVATPVTAEMRRRKKLPKFGEATKTNDGVTLTSNDEIKIERPGRSSDQDTAALVTQLQSAIAKRGNNAGGAASNDFWKKKAENFTGSGISMEGGKPGVYVPRHKRAGASGSSMRENVPTLRVTNLSPNTMEVDVRDLFSRFGRVARCYLATTTIEDPDGKKPPRKICRGFAFVSFDSKKDAANAMKNLDRYPYDNLILRVEWAKPSTKKNAGSGGGLSASNTSGYGKRLPQTAATQQRAPQRRN